MLLLSLFPEPPEAYFFTGTIQQRMLEDTSSYGYQQAAWEYSFVGEYQKALWAYDHDTGGYPPLSDEQQAHFLSFRPIDATEFILQRAEQEQIIMINEAHHQPVHRVFTTSLLEGLYQRGFRFLGLEGLSHTDSLLNKRGYPVWHSGYYIQEPQFGNLVREALRIGYEVFAYEAQDMSNGKEREIQQARNIQRMLKAHPEGKFLIHCGFDHINESAVAAWEKAMAGRVREYTGINPFTINQEILTEKYTREKENPFFRLVDTLAHPSVFVRGDSLFRGAQGDTRYDVRLYHPRTTYRSGRPAWLGMNGARRFYSLDPKTINIAYPVIICAYAKEETEASVPVDVIEMKSFSDQKALVLPEGKYVITLHNPQGDTLRTSIDVE